METASYSILDEVRDFLKSRVILTAADLDLFTRLSNNPITADQLAKEKDLDPRAVTRLLDCLVTQDLLEKSNGLYRTAEKASHLDSRHPESVLPMVLHMNHLWNSWSHLTETIQLGKNPEPKPVTERGLENLKAFIGAMNVVGRKLAFEIAEAANLSRFKRLLDVGGASGTYTVAFLKTNPELKAVLFDLPDVIAMADDNLTKEGLRERVDLVTGDFYKDELPGGCDLALLSAIIHQNSPEQNLELYGKVFGALTPGGTILIRDHIMEENRTEPAGGAFFALNMLVNTAGGDTYTFAEVKDTLEKAGFVNVRQTRKGQKMDCLVEARKP